jgi:hypothetical protein
MAQINIKKNASASVSTPPSGVQAIFIGTDGILYGKSDAGAVTQLAGLTGPAGSAGSSGSSGISGSSGSSGTSGAAGENGSSGSSGTSGVNGATGASGSSGSSGVNGSSGSSGTSGATGNNGSSGSSGTSGVNGTSGTSPSGGGAAGLVAGVGYNSVQSNTTLTPGATAAGSDSVAIGASASSASLNGDVVIGSKLTALAGNGFGNRSVLIGNNSSSDPYGRANVVIGFGLNGFNGAVNIGTDNNCDTDRSYALGQLNTSLGNGSIAIGYSNTLEDTGDISIGSYNFNNTAGIYNVSIGGGLLVRNSSVSFGLSSQATGLRSFSVGVSSLATHDESIVLGSYTASVVPNALHVKGLYLYSTAGVYADNATALTAGLTAGQVYRKSDGTLMIAY